MMKYYDDMEYQYEEILNLLYKKLIEMIKDKGYIIDPDGSPFLTDNYSKNDISNLPENEADAYLYILNVTKAIMTTSLLLDYKINKLVTNAEDLLIKNEKDLNKLYDLNTKQLCLMITLIYSCKICTDIAKENTKLYDYHLSKDRFYDFIDSIVNESTVINMDCKEVYDDLYKAFTKKSNSIFTRAKYWLKSKWLKFKIYLAWLFAEPTTQFADIINTYSPYPIDATRQKYGEIFEDCIDRIKFAVEKLNGLPILELFMKYENDYLVNYFPDKYKERSDCTIVINGNDEEKEVDKILLDLIDDAMNDLENVKIIRDTVTELNTYIQRKVTLLILNYKMYKDKK